MNTQVMQGTSTSYEISEERNINMPCRWGMIPRGKPEDGAFTKQGREEEGSRQK